MYLEILVLLGSLTGQDADAPLRLTHHGAMVDELTCGCLYNTCFSPLVSGLRTTGRVRGHHD